MLDDLIREAFLDQPELRDQIDQITTPPEQILKLTFQEEHLTDFHPDRKTATKGGSQQANN